MAKQAGWKKELRQRVVTALADQNHTFQLTEFIEEFGVEPDTVAAVAEALYSRTYVQCLADQVISSHENKRLRRLAELLGISDKRGTELANLAGKEAYRAQHAKAMLDGTISDAERAQLQQLLGTIADQAGSDAEPQESHYREDKSPHAKAVDGGKSSASKVSRSELVNQALALGITKVKSKNMALLQSEIDAVRGGERGIIDFDEAGFQKTLVYKSKSSPETVIAQLSSLRSMDKKIEETRKKYSIVLLAGGLAFVGGFLGILALDGLGAGIVGLIVVLLLMAGGALAFIWGMYCLNANSMQDVPDRRYEAALGILKLVRKDLAQDSLVEIQVDCRPHNHKSKKVRTGKVSYWNVKYHVDNWFVLRGAFADGTKFSMMLIEKHQDRSRTKRSASGKIKHKSKTKIASEAILRFKIKPKKNPDLRDGWQGRVKSNHAAVRLPNWTQRKSLDAKGDRITLRSTTKSSWDAVNRAQQGKKKVERDGVKWMAMMFLSLYGVLDAAKPNSKEGK
ncbi:hypothetical protein OAM37_00915 [bacterium]|nr:hypothetical protein [bacterium]MDC0317064.1 hypothetical protein [bacterium]